MGADHRHVFDNSCDDGPRSYRTGGIEAAARGAGAKVAPGWEMGSYGRMDLEALDIRRITL